MIVDAYKVPINIGDELYTVISGYPSRGIVIRLGKVKPTIRTIDGTIDLTRGYIDKHICFFSEPNTHVSSMAFKIPMNLVQDMFNNVMDSYAYIADQTIQRLHRLVEDPTDMSDDRFTFHYGYNVRSISAGSDIIIKCLDQSMKLSDPMIKQVLTNALQQTMLSAHVCEPQKSVVIRKADGTYPITIIQPGD